VTDTTHYDFDRWIDRRASDSIKWAFNEQLFGDDDVISMWIADMDFAIPEPVSRAIQQRAAHPIYGYPMCAPTYSDALIAWWRRRHHWEIQKEWLTYNPGVIPALVVAILAFTQPGDKIVIQPPVYPPFFNIVKHNGRQIVENALRVENGRYQMDFADLEKRLDSRTKMLILCNPHNPVGRVWTRAELTRLGEICLAKHIIIVSDEIHADIVYPWAKHVPIASISDAFAQNTITCLAPSKTFNLAGLYASATIIPNPRWQAQFNHTLESLAHKSINVLGIVALEAAYRCGEAWLDQLLDYLRGNLDLAMEYIAARIPEIQVIRPEGTYLLWLDCRALGLAPVALKEFMLKQARVALNDGPTFGTQGEGFQRMNIACPRTVLAEALRRIEAAVNTLRPLRYSSPTILNSREAARLSDDGGK